MDSNPFSSFVILDYPPILLFAAVKLTCLRNNSQEVNLIWKLHSSKSIKNSLKCTTKTLANTQDATVRVHVDWLSLSSLFDQPETKTPGPPFQSCYRTLCNHMCCAHGQLEHVQTYNISIQATTSASMHVRHKWVASGSGGSANESFSCNYLALWTVLWSSAAHNKNRSNGEDSPVILEVKTCMVGKYGTKHVAITQ